MSHWEANDRRKLAPVAECDLQDYDELLPLDVRQQLRLPQQTQRRLPKGLKPTATPIVGPLKTLPITSTRNDLLASIESDPVIGETSFAENCLVLVPDNTRLDAEEKEEGTVRASRSSHLSLMKISPMASGPWNADQMQSEKRLQQLISLKEGRSMARTSLDSMLVSSNSIQKLEPFKLSNPSTMQKNFKNPQKSKGSEEVAERANNNTDSTVRQQKSAHFQTDGPPRAHVLPAAIEPSRTLETSTSRATRAPVDQLNGRRSTNGKNRTSERQPAAAKTDTSSIASDANSLLLFQRVSCATKSTSRLQTDTSSMIEWTTSTFDGNSSTNNTLLETAGRQPSKQRQPVGSVRAVPVRPEIRRPLETCSLLEADCCHSLRPPAAEAECASASGCDAGGTGTEAGKAPEEAGTGRGHVGPPLCKIPLETRSLLEPLEPATLPLSQHEALSLALRREYRRVNKTSLLRLRGDRPQKLQLQIAPPPELEVNKRSQQTESRVGGGPKLKAKALAAAAGGWTISECSKSEVAAAGAGGVKAFAPPAHLTLYTRTCDKCLRLNSRHTRELNGRLKLLYGDLTQTK